MRGLMGAHRAHTCVRRLECVKVSKAVRRRGGEFSLPRGTRSWRPVLRRMPRQTCRSQMLRPHCLNSARLTDTDSCDFTLPIPMLMGNVTALRPLRSCAVVSSSGALINSSCGASIDAHDATIRMNFAPFLGFEADVGSRTTIYVVNSHNARLLALAAKKLHSKATSKPVSARAKSPMPALDHARIEESGSRKPHPSMGRRLSTRVAKHEDLLTQVCRTATSLLFFGDEWLADDDEASTMRLINRQQPCGGSTEAFPQRALKLRKQVGAWGGAMIRAYDALAPRMRPKTERPLDRAEIHALPSSGWYSTLFALAQCRSVSLYGFELDGESGSSARSSPFHYYEAAGSSLGELHRREMSHSHNAGREKRHYLQLSSGGGRVKVCRSGRSPRRGCYGRPR